ncbi:MAG: hypothetical protein Q8S13_04135, partial [Dehalococcoidia bacterium]|nr:hypothetical protein [Dehalococcoidia bacterium]
MNPRHERIDAMRYLITLLLTTLVLTGCATGGQPVTSPSGDVIVLPGRQAVMVYADVKQSVRDLLVMVETLCAKKANTKQCGDVAKLRQDFHDLDVRTR